ncbi:SURF1 family protein [Rothia sp. AR01]|uniref:SURF1-like protein n=1 Tax=Rothia santali TaxID=2949643 RepID=A0A9X2HAY3_9MICC|nr:SURF1 family cytochrome oxidase biogenesis protein [Rothia santali]MCP3424875.1 SURF1 family protein [Rothia santali]
MLKLALTPRWLAGLLFALLLATGFMLLSQWQLGSASSGQIHEDPAKEVVEPLEDTVRALEPVFASQADSMVETTGTYVPDSTVLVANRVNDGVPGYWVVTRFVPDVQAPVAPVESGIEDPEAVYSVGVARGFVTDPGSAAAYDEPAGDVTLAGRLIANEAPVASDLVDEATDAAGPGTVLGAAATAQLTNVWDAPLYSGLVTANAEVPAGSPLPLDAEGRLTDAAALAAPADGLEVIRTDQVTDDSLDWLNVFYAIEWVVFAGFALYLWWRMLADAHQRRVDPERFYEFLPAREGRFFYEEETGRYFYYDADAAQYFYFDEPDPSGPAGPIPPADTAQARSEQPPTPERK